MNSQMHQLYNGISVIQEPSTTLEVYSRVAEADHTSDNGLVVGLYHRFGNVPVLSSPGQTSDFLIYPLIPGDFMNQRGDGLTTLVNLVKNFKSSSSIGRRLRPVLTQPDESREIRTLNFNDGTQIAPGVVLDTYRAVLRMDPLEQKIIDYLKQVAFLSLCVLGD